MNEINLEKKLKLGCISGILTENINKKLYGEILTIADSSISDPVSRKAVKSLISQAFTRITSRVMSELNNFREE